MEFSLPFMFIICWLFVLSTVAVLSLLTSETFSVVYKLLTSDKDFFLLLLFLVHRSQKTLLVF